MWLWCQLFDHRRHHIRLRDGLPCSDAYWMITISAVEITCGNETVARELFHCIQDFFIADPHGAQFLYHRATRHPKCIAIARCQHHLPPLFSPLAEPHIE